MKMNSEVIRIVRVIGASFAGTVLSIIFAIFLARVLTVESRGEVQLFTTIITVMSAIMIGGLGNTISYSVRNGEYKGWGKIFVFFMMVVFVISSVYAFFKFSEIKFSALLVIQVFLFSIITFTLEISKVQISLKYYKIINITQPALCAFFFFIVYFSYFSINTINSLYLVTVCYLISAITCLFFIYRINKEININNKINEINFIKYWLRQNIFQSFGVLTKNIDKLFIGYLLDFKSLGLYSVCIAFDSVPSRFYQALSDYLFSGMINNKRKDKEVLIIGILGGSAGVALTYLLSEYLVMFVFGKEYITAAKYLPYIVLSSVISGLSWILSQKILIIGRQLLLVARQMVSIFVFIAIFFITKDYGLWSAVIALNAGAVIRLIISMHFYLKYKV